MHPSHLLFDSSLVATVSGVVSIVGTEMTETLSPDVLPYAALKLSNCERFIFSTTGSAAMLQNFLLLSHH